MTEVSVPLVECHPAASDLWTPRESRATIGVASADMTPPVGIRAHNWGAARTQVATGVHYPLTASALSIRDGDAWRDIVTLDLCTFGAAETFTLIFDGIAAQVGSDRDHLLLHLVHTHAGPSLAAEGTSLPGAELIAGYREALTQKVADAILQARASATDSVVTWAYGTCGMATNRDLPCVDRDITGFNPAIAPDDTVLVGRVAASDGNPVAILVNYACHPTTLAFENSLLSADYVATTRLLVEQATGAQCIFFQGASGDQAPRDQYLPGTELAERNGRSLGYSVLTVLETIGTPGARLRLTGVVESGAPLAIWQEEAYTVPTATAFDTLPLELETRPAPTAEEIAQRWSGIDPVAAQERLARAQRITANLGDGDLPYATAIWTLGGAIIVAHPGEAYALLQTELRRRHPGQAVLVLNLTNPQVAMYLPTREAYARDRYQVWQTRAAPGSLEALIEAVDAHIGKVRVQQ